MLSNAMIFNTFAFGPTQVVCAKSTRSHVALRMRNSGAESGRELFKGSKDAASPLVCTEKKFLVGDADFL